MVDAPKKEAQILTLKNMLGLILLLLFLANSVLIYINLTAYREISEHRALIAEVFNDVKNLNDGSLSRNEMLVQALQSLEGYEAEDITAGLVINRQVELERRIATIENTINAAPSEVVSVYRVNERVELLENALSQRSSDIQREIDRMFTILISVIAGLGVAIFANILINLGRSRN